MAHSLAGALQQAGGISQFGAVEESDVDVRGECIDIGKRRISETCNGTAVMQKFPNFVAARSHDFKPVTRDGAQFRLLYFHPDFDGGITLDGAVEAQYVIHADLPGFGFVFDTPGQHCTQNVLHRPKAGGRGSAPLEPSRGGRPVKERGMPCAGGAAAFVIDDAVIH
jgi:hypothetical protein